MITASHNPVGYNGLKIIAANASSVEYTSGLKKLEELVNSKDIFIKKDKANSSYFDITDDYIRYLKI